MNRNVIYTAIIGGYDELVEPDVVPDGWDFICFSDRSLRSSTWKVRRVQPACVDNTRAARKHKLLAHRLFPEYDISLWIDGNIKIRADVNELVTYLDDCNYATYDHSQNVLDPRDCIYEEAKAILRLGDANMQRTPERGKSNYKDDPEIIQRQVEKYRSEGYPQHAGLVVQMEVLRRHGEQDVTDAMENHWIELKNFSKREQLSFNYIAWKHQLRVELIPGDSRDNKYFLHMGTHKAKRKVPRHGIWDRRLLTGWRKWP